MNIAVISIKDIFKYVLKIGIIVCLIYMCIQLVNISKNTSADINQNKLKETLDDGVQKINNYSFLDCLDISMSLFSYKKDNDMRTKILTNTDILAMGTGIFDKSIFQNTDLVINEEELTIDDAEELASKIEELPSNVTTEEVEKNNITPKYTTSYSSVKINNQSDYELTETILKPDIEIKNKKDILIYHTHTCESYTPSERI